MYTLGRTQTIIMTRKSIMTDHGPINQDIYCLHEVPIHPNNEEKEIKFKWKDILDENPPEASFNRESYFRLDLVQYHEFIEEVLYRGPNSDKSKEAGSRNP